MDYRKIGFWQLVLLAFILNFVAQALHEAGHWVVLETAGRRPVWSFTELVQIWGNPPPLHPEQWLEITSPDGEKGWERMASQPGRIGMMLMEIGGPLASVLGVVLGLSLMRFVRNPVLKQMGLVLAMIITLVMGFYYLRGFTRASGDEYFLAALLGIPKYILMIPFSLFYITSFILEVLALGNWRTRVKWLGAVMVGSLPAGVFLVYATGLVISQVDRGNLLFQPVLGWSLPVLVVNLAAWLALWFWGRGRNAGHPADR
jgi:hypothetical protein